MFFKRFCRSKKQEPRKKGDRIENRFTGIFAPVCLYLLWDNECSSHCPDFKAKENCDCYQEWSTTTYYQSVRAHLADKTRWKKTWWRK